MKTAYTCMTTEEVANTLRNNGTMTVAAFATATNQDCAVSWTDLELAVIRGQAIKSRTGHHHIDRAYTYCAI